MLKWVLAGIASIFIILYLIFMVLVPLHTSNFNFSYLFSVLHHWQVMNASMIAFISSWLLFFAAVYRDRKQKSYEEKSARAFLAGALSGISHYLEECIEYLNEAYKCSEARSQSLKYSISLPEPVLDEAFYKEDFSNGIKYLSKNVGYHLADILTDLQIIRSRIKDKKKAYEGDTSYELPINIECDMKRVAELSVKVNHLYPFSRSRENTQLLELKLDAKEVHSALVSMEIYDHDFPNLFEMIKRMDY